MAADDKDRARQLRAEARRRRRDEALRRYRERTASGESSPAASGRRRRTAVETNEEAERAVDSAVVEGSTADDAPHREPDESVERETAEQEAAEQEAREAAEREAAEREAREAAEREAAEREAREAAAREAEVAAEREERARRQPLTAAEIAGSDSAAEEPSDDLPDADDEPEPPPAESSPEENPGEGETVEPTVSMTEGLPAAPRDLAPRRDLVTDRSADVVSAVPAPVSPRRSMGVRGLRALGTLAVALGSIASLLLAIGALALALGERPAALFDALEPVCRTLAFGTGDDAAAVDLLVTWIIAGLAYLVIGFALQSFTRRVTRRRSRG